MNNAKLAQATLMALTMQNVTPRTAPNSTATMKGIVINHSIQAGDTVCCYYNDFTELIRLGDIPNYSSNFYIDKNGKMYDVADGKLRIRDGISGYVYDDESRPAYGFNVYHDCCAYKSSESEEYWCFITPDGIISKPILIDSQNLSFVNAGYRNGVLAVFYTYSGGAYPSDGHIHTYTPDGDAVAILPLLGQNPITLIVVPVNYYTCVAYTFFDAAYGQIAAGYVVTPQSTTAFNPFDGYDVSSGISLNVATIGADQSYLYMRGIIRNAGDQVVVKTPIDNPTAGSTTIFYGDAYQYSTCSRYAHTVRSRTVDGVTVGEMIDLSLGQAVYTTDLSDPYPCSFVRETETYIWIPANGVYQKTPEDWLMYPTSVYPTQSPWGKLGYAVYGAEIGKEGLAVVLFDKG